MTPSDIRTYGPDERRRHRLRRALHELMADPGYHITANGDRLLIGPAEMVTPEAEEFIRRWKPDLVQHVAWLGEGK